MNRAIVCLQNANLFKAITSNPSRIHSNNLFTSSTRLAGHSKWQNIRHTKAAKDQEKSTLFSNLQKKLRMAIKEGGGVDPKFNYRLAGMIDYCKKNNMPMSTIENTLKSSQNEKKTEPLMLEVKGPRNAMIMISCLTANKALTKQNLATPVRRSPLVKWLDSGSALSKFDVKGQIYAKVPPGLANPEETCVDDGIEVGAEEVNRSEVEVDHYEFITDPKDMMQIKGKLEKKGYDVIRAEVEYIPAELAVLSPEELEGITALYAKIEAVPEVIQIYDNIECS